MCKASLLIVVGLASCSDFIESSIAQEELELLSPGSGAETNDYSPTFLWEPVPYALQYRFQIASPSFDAINLIYADSITSKARISITLEPGTYEWRVKAINGSSESRYVTRSLVVHESALSRQTVLLLTPGAGYQTARSHQDFSWQPLYNAQYYRLQVDTNTFSEFTEPLFEQVSQSPSIPLTLEIEGRYLWRVRAENDTAHARWSEERAITYDITPPQAPTPSFPANLASVDKPVILRWIGSADAAKYRVYVYRSDSTLYSNAYPVNVHSDAFTLGHGVRGERILWRVSSLDAAGNESSFSPWRGFVWRN